MSTIVEHEKEWDKFNELKTVLEEIRQILVEYAEIPGQVAGVPSLIIEH
ncbi:hypothetical protein [Bacillus pseudomycoides]|nr:hypothetical protein [Bacillus pseudomycoides]EEM12012.1 hypothetical protein bmyco0003_10590 [Bacillus pseudomycoides]